jgi:hypothetical protein
MIRKLRNTKEWIQKLIVNISVCMGKSIIEEKMVIVIINRTYKFLSQSMPVRKKNNLTKCEGTYLLPVKVPSYCLGVAARQGCS